MRSVHAPAADANHDPLPRRQAGQRQAAILDRIETTAGADLTVGNESRILSDAGS